MTRPVRHRLSALEATQIEATEFTATNVDFTGNVDVAGTFESGGAATFGDDVDVVGDGSFGGDLEATGDLSAATIALANMGVLQVAEVDIGAAQLGGAETDTDFAFPATGAILVAAWLKVTDTASGTIDVGTQGTSNDPDGILDGVSTAAAGYVGQVPSAKGALIGCFITGNDPVSVTASGDLSAGAAKLYIAYIELPVIPE